MKRFFSLLLCAALALSMLPAVFQSASAEEVRNFNIRLDAPVASYTPDFTPQFSTNAQVNTTVTWQENSPGFSAKLGSSDEFRAGLAYKVEIWVLLGDGAYLATHANGDLDTAITVNGQAISSLKINGRNGQGKINQFTVTCEYDPLPGSQISSVLVTGVPTPVAGNMPIYSFTVGSNAYDYYHTAPVVWWDQTTGREMDSGDTFIQGHVYQLNIWLAANRQGGFTFKTDKNGNPQVSATINSWAADSVTKAYEQDGREVIDIRYNFPACPAAHTCAPVLVPLQKQTCVLPGFKAYYECACGKCYEDAAGKIEITDMDGYGIIPADGHKEGAWSYNSTHHYKVCSTCKEIIPGTQVAHTGGTASCIAKPVCTVCNAAYGQQDPDHRWSPGWSYQDADGHAWVCADCKTHSTVQAHKAGPAATDTEPQKCTECGYIITPAKNHVHKLTLVEEREPTCSSVGNLRYYLCDGCSELFADADGKQVITDSVLLPMKEHTPAEAWEKDGQQHWKACRFCGLQLTDTVALHDAEPCSVCGYGADPEEPTQAPTEPQEQQKPDAGGVPGWAIAIMIGLIFFGISLVVAVLLLKRKGKNNA